MAALFPKSVVIRASHTTRFLRFITEPVSRRGEVTTQEESIFNPFCKIEIETAKIDTKFVHLRFSHANKYWARRGPGMNGATIVASSNQPEEDISKISCTLFEPILQNNGTISFRHVQSGGLVRAGGGLFVEDGNIAVSPPISFTIVDLDTLVILPKLVTFKDENDNYLKGTRLSNGNHLEVSSDHGTDIDTAYEITTNPDGHIRIKSLLFDRFWRRTNNWIYADSNDTTGNNRDTLFWPVKINDNTIVLRSASNNRFCKRFTTAGRTNCLSAEDIFMSRYSRLRVEELVLERGISHVRFRMDEARIYDEMASIAGFGSAINESDEEADLTVSVGYEDTTSYTFSNSLSIATGVSYTFRTGLPFISEHEVQVSLEVTKSFEWNRTTEETKTAESECRVVVPPKSSVRVNFVATRGCCSVPFSYTQRDKLATNGSIVTTQHDDGIYNGVNYYSFHFEKKEVQPL